MVISHEPSQLALTFYFITFIMLSLFLVSSLQTLYFIPKPLLLWRCSSTHPPTPTYPPLIHLPWGIYLAFIEQRTIDRILVLHKTKDKAITCYLCSWSQVYFLLDCLVPGSSGVGVWLVDIVVFPMGLQTPSAPSVLSLTPPLGFPCSVQWLAASICLCICQVLAEPLRRQL